MPGLITIPEFVREAREDFNSPTTSTFCNRIPHCRDTISRYDEVCILVFFILRLKKTHFYL